jgi:uncharacterized protein (TIGR03435 family)
MPVSDQRRLYAKNMHLDEGDKTLKGVADNDFARQWGKKEVKSMIRPIGVAVFAMLSTCEAFAQSAATRPTFDEFEVATVKPAIIDERGSYIKMQSARRFFVKNYTLKALVAAAYNLTARAISGGPAWVGSDRFDILAETPGEVQPNLDEQMSMLRKLLTDRFKLTFHREPKEFSIYALTVAKNGPKLKESTAPPDKLPELINVVFPDRISLPARNATIAQFTSMLQRGVLDRPVVDKTGLSGKYDFDLEWADDESQFGGRLRKRASADDSDKPDLFAAIQQQLGLRLEATKGQIEALVIDQVERPSEN